MSESATALTLRHGKHLFLSEFQELEEQRESTADAIHLGKAVLRCFSLPPGGDASQRQLDISIKMGFFSAFVISLCWRERVHQACTLKNHLYSQEESYPEWVPFINILLGMARNEIDNKTQPFTKTVQFTVRRQTLEPDRLGSSSSSATRGCVSQGQLLDFSVAPLSHL